MIKKPSEFSMSRIISQHMIFVLILLCSPIFLSSASAATLDALGSAVITDNKVTAARLEAYQDALRQISIQAEATISSDTRYNDSEGISDSIQIRTHQKIKSSEIISETIDQGILTVKVRAQLSNSAKKQAACHFPAAQYRKRITAVFFPLQYPQHLNAIDYFGFEHGIPQEILQRLSRSGDFLTREAIDYNLYPDINLAPYIQDQNSADKRSMLSLINQQLKAQYVLSGIVRDLSLATVKNQSNLPFGLSLSRDQFVSLNKQPDKPNKRHLVIDFYLHDTLSEELISKHRYSYSVDNAFVLPEKSTAFATKAFFSSAYGQLFERVLQQETQLIRDVLACRPFTMKVLDQKNNKIYLDAGQNSKIKAGDILTLYYADEEGESFDSNSSRKQFGWPKQRIKIIKVFPSYAIANSNDKQVIHLKKNQDYILVR